MNKKTPFERYLKHLDDIFIVEPEFNMFDSTNPKLSGVTSIIYKDIPEKGMITGVTYGLSLEKHDEWLKNKRGELIITVNSEKTDWALVVGYIANKLRGETPFCYGDTINFGEKISNDSEMSAFTIFAPSILESEDYLDIDIGLNYKINISGLYPIYSSEIDFINSNGFEKFLDHENFDLYSINRNKVE
ncbi:suppressor of fused domain protein [Tenacibaculum sp. M341]|uniref:suppressor of fused domain protein n=1 Tax=Tenacibaculum sp. M341 TaxID=2530339 RepID=UPI001043C269|nr:suppressor of fused domain protein [Tenacibaculum sp. M341]TCI93809.1 hypothetical protein EYW44_05170 [Tenacibaculum sp. M341]